MSTLGTDTQAELEDRLQFETLLAELSARFANLSADEIDREIEHALRSLVETLHADRAALGRTTQDGRDLVVTDAFAVPGVETFPLLPSLATEAPLLSRTLLSGRPFVMARLADLPPEAEQERKLFASHQILSGIVVPLMVGGRVIGGVGCSLARGEREWPKPVVRGLRLIADVLANALARHHADQALQASEKRARLSATAANVGLWLWDVSRDEVWASEQARALYGVGPDEPLHFRRFMACLHPDDRIPAEGNAQRALQKGGEYRAEYRVVHTDGAVHWLHVVGLCQPDAEGRPARLMGASLDISEHWNSAILLRDALQKAGRMQARLRQDNLYLQKEVKSSRGYGRIVGHSPALLRVLSQVEQVAPTLSSVLLLGETGTGKELFATAIHEMSPRRDRVMVRVNCAAIPVALIESELFGREKGAYTGSLARQIGRFELADGSTLFLDEISELPAESQAKLLRALQEKEIQRLGSPKPIKVDVRVIAATNRDLAEAVAAGRFREDLYYRLNVFPITVPPLRDRREDIPLLVWSFVDEFSKAMGKSIEAVSKASLRAMGQYPWPGNVRELRNAIERAMILADGPTLAVDPPSVAPIPAHRNLATLAEVERDHIQRVLEATHWRVRGAGGAAEILGLPPTTLESRMAKLGLHRNSSR
jgi:PAS domain S-box-containing protein